MKLMAVLGILALAAGAVFQTRQGPAKEREEYVLVIDESRADGAPAEAIAPEQTVRLRLGDTVEELPLNEYLTCVVLSETLPTFSPEALKAQAVAARTFTWKTAQTGKHPDADVCGDPACCQAYAAPEELRARFGEDFDDYWQNAADAVAATDGEAVYYGGELIEAVYYSCSGGRSEPAVAVWGGDVPYLQAVESPGEEFSPTYAGVTAVPIPAFRRVLRESAGVELPVFPEDWFGEVTYTDGGGVQTARVGGKDLAGTELRRWFSLPSTRFTMELSGPDVVFHTLGYGHRVGMSQYGAEAMARQGKTYREILKHYYTGVEIR